MDLRAQRVLSVCAGTGQLDVGLQVALPSARVVGYVEHEAYPCHVLASRIEDEALDDAPIWTDLHTFNGGPWRGKVDGIVGGYPCQPFSLAGKGLAERDPRHLWPRIRELIRVVDPWWCFFENVPGHVNRGLRTVLGDLEAIGFRVVCADGRPTFGIFSAEEVGASHRRERLFILAYRPESQRSGRALQVGDGEEGRGGSRGEGQAVAYPELRPRVSSAGVQSGEQFPVPGGASGVLAESGSSRLQDAEYGRIGAQAVLKWAGEVRAPAPELRGTFAPGPGDLDSWGRVVADGSGDQQHAVGLARALVRHTAA